MPNTAWYSPRWSAGVLRSARCDAAGPAATSPMVSTACTSSPSTPRPTTRRSVPGCWRLGPGFRRRPRGTRGTTRCARRPRRRVVRTRTRHRAVRNRDASPPRHRRHAGRLRDPGRLMSPTAAVALGDATTVVDPAAAPGAPFPGRYVTSVAWAIAEEARHETMGCGGGPEPRSGTAADLIPLSSISLGAHRRSSTTTTSGPCAARRSSPWAPRTGRLLIFASTLTPALNVADPRSPCPIRRSESPERNLHPVHSQLNWGGLDRLAPSSPRGTSAILTSPDPSGHRAANAARTASAPRRTTGPAGDAGRGQRLRDGSGSPSPRPRERSPAYRSRTVWPRSKLP